MPEFAGPLNQQAPSAPAVDLVTVPDLTARDDPNNVASLRVGAIVRVVSDGNYYQLLTTTPTWDNLGSSLGGGSSDWVVVADIAARNALSPSAGQRAFVQGNVTLYHYDGAVWIEVWVEPIADGSTVYVDPAGGDDENDGTVGSPYASIPRARRRWVDGFGGKNTIQLVGAGPFNEFPQDWPSAGDNGGSLDIVGDRSSPLVSNATPTWVAVPNTNSRYEDTGFGAHGGFAAGTHWAEIDYSGALPNYSIDGWPVFAQGAGSTIEVMQTFNNTGIGPVTVYPLTSQINFDGSASGKAVWSMKNQGIDGFNPGCIRIIGCIINYVNGVCPFINFITRGCTYTGSATGVSRFIDCMVGGYIPPTFPNTLIFVGTAGVQAQARGYPALLHCEEKAFIAGDSTMSHVKLDNEVELNAGSRLTAVNRIEIDHSRPAAFIGRTGSVLAFSPQTDVAFVDGGVDSFYDGENNAVVDLTGCTVSGNLGGDGVILGDGARGVNLAALSGMTITGNDIDLGGAGGTPFASLPANDLGAGTPEGCFAT